jgi:hypothetical protein
LLGDTFCAGERFCVIPVGVAEGRLNAVEPARPRQTFRSTRRFLAVSNSWQSIAETYKGDSRTGEFSLRRSRVCEFRARIPRREDHKMDPIGVIGAYQVVCTVVTDGVYALPGVSIVFAVLTFRLDRLRG